MFISCNDDDNTSVSVPEPWAAPETYTFERNGVSTISFGGQTTRLSQTNELYDELNSSSASIESLTLMFAGGADGKSAGFTDENLNGTTKLIRSKTSASAISGSSAVKDLFDNWITEYVTDVIPNVLTATDASVGQAGIFGKYAFNAKGHEIDQLFFKGLIGAFTLDQIINNYIDASYLESYKADNEADVISGTSAPYTTMEHKWDEGFGYLYGHVNDGVAEDLAVAGTTPSGSGNLLMKYFKKVNDSDSKDPEIAMDVYNAFKMGRAAIVNKDYTVMEEQSTILKQKLSSVIGHYAVHYLSGAISTIGSSTGADRLSAFHGLSEGYGFVLSLQFTNDGTDSPYFTKDEVDVYLAQIDNFYTVDTAILQTIHDEIKSRFGI
ncbi:MAG: DUF4856 domain-containing protein [Flavobacteriaceae bacterium]|nr:DUF4856 domain-containing protein [Flavobacteriaceae bacterium]|tara:strand:+ start:3068 stop:4210 length:1143 start_codon:yes stop_codon:yes gene_type:complete